MTSSGYMRKIRYYMAAAAVLAAVFAPQAQAGTTIIAPPDAQRPYQQWIEEAQVPTPPLTVEVREVASMPCGRTGFACSYPLPSPWRPISIEARVGTGFDRWYFLHELGHIFDWNYMEQWQRDYFIGVLMQEPDIPWEDHEPVLWADSGEERFADAYSLCLGLRHPISVKWVLEVGGRLMGGRALRKTCRMIARTPLA